MPRPNIHNSQVKILIYMVALTYIPRNMPLHMSIFFFSNFLSKTGKELDLMSLQMNREFPMSYFFHNECIQPFYVTSYTIVPLRGKKINGLKITLTAPNVTKLWYAFLGDAIWKADNVIGGSTSWSSCLQSNGYYKNIKVIDFGYLSHEEGEELHRWAWAPPAAPPGDGKMHGGGSDGLCCS
jgi:hypothetical protein